MDDMINNADDKSLVIIAAFILGLVSLFLLKDASVVNQALSGLFGVAVGKG